MDLIVWRHAEAQEAQPGEDDLQRALTPRGRKQAERMAAWLDAQLPQGTRVLCPLNAPSVPALAKELGTTRSAAAVELWKPELKGAVIVIGNAPTALFALLEAIDAGADKPAAIIGLPVGFVGAAESKAELAANPRAIPYITLLGRRGGSAMAAAALNAMTAEGKS